MVANRGGVAAEDLVQCPGGHSEQVRSVVGLQSNGSHDPMPAGIISPALEVCNAASGPDLPQHPMVSW